MTSTHWDELNNREKLGIVTRDIQQLIHELISLTAPNGELDSALEESLESFEPLLQAFSIKLGEEDDLDVLSEASEDDQLIEQIEGKSKSSTDESKHNEGEYALRVGMNSESTVSAHNVQTVRKTSSDRGLTRRGTLENFDQPGPSGIKTMLTRASVTRTESSESVYETVTHFIPPARRLHDSDEEYDKSLQHSRIY